MTELKEQLKEFEKEDMFAKYGFEKPKFECELFFVSGTETIYGLVDDDDNMYFNDKFPLCWSKDGTAIGIENTDIDYYYYNLTPIKKPWYDDENNFPTLCMQEFTRVDSSKGYRMKRIIRYTKGIEYCFLDDNGGSFRLNDLRPASNEEIDSLKRI